MRGKCPKKWWSRGNRRGRPRIRKAMHSASDKQVEPHVEGPLLLNFDESRLVDLASDIWKLERNAKKALSLDEHRPLKSSIGKLFAYLDSYGVRVEDYTGERYHENLNVKVLSTVEDVAVTVPTVKDTVNPAVLINEKLVSHGAVIVGVPVANRHTDTQERDECEDE